MEPNLNPVSVQATCLPCATGSGSRCCRRSEGRIGADDGVVRVAAVPFPCCAAPAGGDGGASHPRTRCSERATGRGATRGRETSTGCPPRQMRWKERGSLAAVAAAVAAVVGAATSGRQPLSDPLGPLQPRPPLTSPVISGWLQTQCLAAR